MCHSLTDVSDGREISNSCAIFDWDVSKSLKRTQQHDPCAVQEENLKLVLIQAIGKLSKSTHKQASTY